MAYYDDFLNYGDGGDPRFGGGGDMYTPTTQTAPPLPAGWVRNPDGTITIPPGEGYTGGTVPALPEGYDPATGRWMGGGTPPTLPTQDYFLPGQQYGIQQNVTPMPEVPYGNDTSGGYGQGGGPAGGSGGYGGTGGGSDFQFPQFAPPQYQPGAAFGGGLFRPPKPFEYGDFKAPTLEEAQNRPGYQFALDQGRKALESSAAARGVLRTGGTLKDLFSWGDKFGEQNYGNQFAQDLTSYTTNRENAADAYRLNYGISKEAFDANYGSSKDVYDRANQQGLDTFDRLYRGATDTFNPQYNAATLKFSDLYNRDRDKLNALTQLAGYGV